VPLVVSARFQGPVAGSFTVRGRTRDGADWSATVPAQRREAPAVAALWARGQLRQLEDRYVTGDTSIEQRITDTSLRFGVLCRFTAYVAVDSRVVNEGGQQRRITQPVEPASGWAMLQETPAVAAGGVAGGMTLMAASAPMAAPARGTHRTFAAKARRAPMAPDSAMFGPVPTFRPGPAPVEPLTSTRQVAATEAARLRAAAGQPAHERRDLLADLASRLGALVSHLATTGVAEAEYAPLRRLVDAINRAVDHAINHGGEFELEPLWAEALRVLDAFGGSSAPPERRSHFWKR
jgi:Ca-activated chloride channel family protein